MPWMTAKIDAKRPKVNENVVAITSALVFMPWIYKKRGQVGIKHQKFLFKIV